MRSFCFLVVALMLPVTAVAQAHVVIVSGLGGEPRYVEDFRNWGLAMEEAAVNRFGIPAENVVLLTEDPTKDSRIDGESRRDAVVNAIASAARAAGADDPFMLLLIGHGSADSRGSRLALPGPDITAEEIRDALAAFRTQPVVVVNTASASGDFRGILAAENRAIVTATRSAGEQNETIFGGYFVEAYASEEADTNRDGRVTLAEAYTFAETETKRDYTNSGRLQLEHSEMESTPEFAEAFHLGSPKAAIPDDASPELRALYEDRIRLEAEIDALRIQSGQIDPTDYQTRLETLLLELARTNRSIQQMESDG